MAGSDTGQLTQLDKSAHILRQSVVTKISIDNSSPDNPRVSDCVIYVSDKNEPEIYPHLAHELIEIGLMQHVLNQCRGRPAPKGFLIQFLAEKKFSDVLVWALQHQILGDTLSDDEKIRILDRLFIVQIGSQKSIDATARILGRDHPLVREFQLYQHAFTEIFRKQNQNEFRAATKEPADRTEHEQQIYGRFLLGFYKLYSESLQKLKAGEAGRNLLLCNPELLLG